MQSYDELLERHWTKRGAFRIEPLSTSRLHAEAALYDSFGSSSAKMSG
jgi:hypothetical protein